MLGPAPDRARFPYKSMSRLKKYVLGPEKSDFSSKTTPIVLFPGLNSQIQVNIPQHLLFNVFFLNLFIRLVEAMS